MTRVTDAPLRLVFVIAGLGGGGSERVLSVLAHQTADRGHDVTLITLDQGPDFYALGPGIRRIRLGIDPASHGVLHRLWIEARLLLSLRAAVRRCEPDTVISFSTETNVRVLVAMIGRRARVVVSERSDPASMPLSAMWATMRQRLYRRAHAVVVQTEDARAWIVKHTGADRTVVIPNPVSRPEPAAAQAAPLPLPQPLIVAMGRLRPEKGYDLLLEAFALTRTQHPDWHLAMIGDGPERASLEHSVRRLGLAGAVSFVGQLARPTSTLLQGRLFVLPSRFEGFPNALVEAMALGMPVIAFDCPGGPGTIIRHEVDGLLVPPADVSALAAAMRRLMADPALRERLAAAAPAVMTRYAVTDVVAQWLAVVRADVAPGTVSRAVTVAGTAA